MPSRFAPQRLLSLTVLSILVISMAGCFRGGADGDNPFLPPSIEFRGLKNLQYDSLIPVTLWMESNDAVYVTLSLSFRQGTAGPFGPTTAHRVRARQVCSAGPS